MNKKILIAEDDKFIANAYRVKLAKVGFDAKIVSNGAEALKIIEEFEPDIILVDLIMPVKDGFDTIKDIRAINKFKKTPILIASNLGQKEDIDKGMKLGANGYITKSDTSLEDIIKKIESYLKI